MVDMSEEEALDCLISCSGSCYCNLVAGPRLLSKLTPSRWENVRPSAVYDLTNLHISNTTSTSESPRRRIKRNSSNQCPLARGALSLPSLRTRTKSKVAPSQKEFSESSYMSGYLDENFSYVHPGGLSEKSGAVEGHNLHKESPTHHCINTEPPLQKRTSQSVSAHNITLGSVFASRLHAAQVDSQTRNEISRIVAMQLRSDVLAEQLFVENRLRNLDLNAFPLLGMGSSNGGQRVNNSLERTKGKSLIVSTPPMVNSASYGTNIQTQRQQSQKRRDKRQRKQQESKAPLDWCPISIQEPHCIANVPFDSPQHRAAAVGANLVHNRHMRFGSLRGSGLKGLALSGVGSSPATKQQSPALAFTQTQKGAERRKKRRSVSYFGQEEFALENSLPKNVQHSEHSLPVVIPMLDQEHVTRSKHRLLSKFSPNSSFANAIS